jgi:hypothetical protein
MSDYIPRFDLNVLASEDDEGNSGFDLNDPAAEDDDADAVFDLDEPEDDHANDADSVGTACSFYPSVVVDFFSVSGIIVFFTVLDLNLPLDEFGAVDFDYVQNLAGNFFLTQSHSF